MARKIAKDKQPASAGNTENAVSPVLSVSDLSSLVGAKGKAIIRVLTSLGPKALSLWPRGSKNLLKHRLASDGVDLLRESIHLELQNYAAIEKQLLDKLVDADDEVMLELEFKLDFLRGKRCQSEIVAKSLSYIQESQGISENASNESSRGEVGRTEIGSISDHWIDHFNRLARLRNESWRAELLARILAAESINPGAVTPRALFSAGILEESSFRIFEFWLNHCVTIASHRMVIWLHDYSTKEVSIPAIGDTRSLHHIRTMLLEPGLTGSHTKLYCALPTVVEYGTRSVHISSKTEKLVIEGSVCTTVGSALAHYHHLEPTTFGYEIFDAWISTIDKSNFTVTEIPTSSNRRKTSK